MLYNQVSYDVIGNLPVGASSTIGTRKLQEHFPAGIVGPVTVLLVNPHFNFRSKEGHAVVARLTDRVHKEANELGVMDIRSLTAPLGLTSEANRNFSGIEVSPEERQKTIEHEAQKHYIGDLEGQTNIATRLDLVLNQSPFSRQSIEDLNRIEHAVRDALPDGLRRDSQLYFVGTTASVRDLANVMQQDRFRIELLVLGSVLVILIAMLRQLVVPLYLLLSVLFSYYTTLGVTFVVFWLLDPHGFNGIDWKVVIFLFTILIAVGEDYNIFLMARVSRGKQSLRPGARRPRGSGSNRPDYFQLRHYHGGYVRFAYGRLADGNEATRFRFGLRRVAGYVRCPAHLSACVSHSAAFGTVLIEEECAERTRQSMPHVRRRRRTRLSTGGG